MLTRKINLQQMIMYDVIIIGGGIVGLSTGHELLKQNPSLKKDYVKEFELD